MVGNDKKELRDAHMKGKSLHVGMGARELSKWGKGKKGATLNVRAFLNLRAFLKKEKLLVFIECDFLLFVCAIHAFFVIFCHPSLILFRHETLVL